MAFPGDWSYYRPLTISENDGTLSETTSVEVTFDTATPIGEGKMESDASDLRVGDGNGNTVPFMIEQDTVNTSSTVIHVYVDSISASGSLDYRIWYGNSGAAYPGDQYLRWIDVDDLSDPWGNFSTGNSDVRGEEVMAGTQNRNDGSDAEATITTSLWQGASGSTIYVYPHWITDEQNEDYAIQVTVDGTTKTGPTYSLGDGNPEAVVDELSFTVGGDDTIDLGIVPLNQTSDFGDRMPHLDGLFVSDTQLSSLTFSADASTNPGAVFFDTTRLSSTVGSESTSTTVTIQGNVTVNGSATSGIQVVVYNKSTGSLEGVTTTDSNSDWSVDVSGSSTDEYYVAYYYDDGSTFYSSAETTNPS